MAAKLADLMLLATILKIPSHMMLALLDASKTRQLSRVILNFIKWAFILCLGDFKLDTYSEVFVGQISALHFISTDSSRVTSTHNFLSITYPYLSMQDLIAFTLSPTTFEAPIEYRARLQKAKGFDNNFLIKFPEKIFLVINPKYESRTHVKDEPLYIIGKQQEYLNPISEILKGKKTTNFFMLI